MPTPEKILFVIDHFRDPYAGAEGQLFQLVSHLDPSRYLPHLLVFSDSAYLSSGQFPCDYTVVGQQRLRSPALWVRLVIMARSFRKQGFRLAHIMFNDASIICPPVFSLVGIKSIITRLDMGYWYTPGLLRTLRLTGRFADIALANSQAVAQVTHMQERIPQERLHVIYNGVADSDGTAPDPVAELEHLKQQGATIAMLVANIRPIKRIQDAVQAVANLGKAFPDLHLVVIGGGDSAALEQQAESAGARQRVHFMGSRNDVPACLHYGDIGLICSESEGFSNSIIEYMQQGLPVVCTAVGGNPEAIQHGENGLLYEVGDVAGLEAQLTNLLSDPEWRQTLGERCRLQAKERYSLAQLAANHQALYDRLIHEGQRGK
ncbi:MAG: glycosyltransferase [Halomonadaceae bacterium]|nr:MAG: glycosyltransferase [Halomonadaceae bacterium]